VNNALAAVKALVDDLEAARLEIDRLRREESRDTEIVDSLREAVADATNRADRAATQRDALAESLRWLLADWRLETAAEPPSYRAAMGTLAAVEAAR
jgi:cell division septum initiation protein DivIVA